MKKPPTLQPDLDRVVVEYTILSGFEVDILPEINALLAMGWQPHGSLIRDQFGCYYQAMTRSAPRLPRPYEIRFNHLAMEER